MAEGNGNGRQADRLAQNAALTATARIMSAVGVPALAIIVSLIAWMGAEQWSWIKARFDRIEARAEEAAREFVKLDRFIAGAVERAKSRDDRLEGVEQENRRQGETLADHERRLIRIEARP